MPSPEVWYILPSASPENCARHLPAWRERGYRIALLQDRIRFDPPHEAGVEAVLTRDQYPGWTTSINALFHEAVPERVPVVVAGGDDMLPDPDHTAREIAEQFLDHFGGTFGVMQPMGDDFERTRWICGSPWMGREWMERMYRGRGGMSEAYFQAFGDDELYWVSRCMHAFWPRPDLTQYHDHFRRRGEPAPRYWVESATAHDRSDCLTFIARAHAGFPGAEPLADGAAGSDRATLDLSVFRREYAGEAERLWQDRYGGAGLDAAADRMRETLASCAREGLERVALYGAGQHTRRVGEALCSPPVEIAWIVDDDPDRIGTRLWHIPVIGMDGAIERADEIDAVLISSDAMEDRLAARAARLGERGVRVLTLYGSRAQERPAPNDPVTTEGPSG